MISFSLAASKPSISAIAWSVTFCTSTSWRFSSSSEIAWSLSSRLQHVEAVAAHVTHRDARVLRVFVGDLDHFLAALLVELGDADAQHRALDRRAEAEIGVADRLVDRVHHRLVPNRDRQRARLRDADRRHLIDRHALAVGFDLDRARAGWRLLGRCAGRRVRASASLGPLHAAFEVGKIESRQASASLGNPLLPAADHLASRAPRGSIETRAMRARRATDSIG